MNDVTEADAQHGHTPPHQGAPHLVSITFDGARREIKAGRYLVSELKTVLGVPAEYELDLVVEGEFKPLADTDHIEVHAHEHFVSHVRRGGSS